MRALGLVMVLALMVRNYWQFRMRAEARATNETILHPFTDRPVTNLTAEMAMDHFAGLQSMQLRRDDVWSRVPQPIHATALQILRLLSVPPSIFWTPPRPKSRPLLI